MKTHCIPGHFMCMPEVGLLMRTVSLLSQKSLGVVRLTDTCRVKEWRADGDQHGLSFQSSDSEYALYFRPN